MSEGNEGGGVPRLSAEQRAAGWAMLMKQASESNTNNGDRDQAIRSVGLVMAVDSLSAALGGYVDSVKLAAVAVGRLGNVLEQLAAEELKERS